MITEKLMDNETFEHRARAIVHLLSLEDPKYPGVNFLRSLIDDVSGSMRQSLIPCALSEENIRAQLLPVARHFLRECSETSLWDEIIASWHSADIYTALAAHLAYASIADNGG